jgi:hypothetical protein
MRKQLKELQIRCFPFKKKGLEGGGKVIHIAIFRDYVNLNPKPSTVRYFPVECITRLRSNKISGGVSV